MSAPCDKPYTSKDKWLASFISGILFLIISSPFTYNSVNTAIRRNWGKSSDIENVILHSALFTIAIRIAMERDVKKCTKPYTNKDKWIISVLSGLLFIIISSPVLYKTIDGIVYKITGVNEIIYQQGQPTAIGLILHTIVFVFVVRMLMR